jgi:hypothetical protein
MIEMRARHLVLFAIHEEDPFWANTAQCAPCRDLKSLEGEWRPELGLTEGFINDLMSIDCKRPAASRVRAREFHSSC